MTQQVVELAVEWEILQIFRGEKEMVEILQKIEKSKEGYIVPDLAKVTALERKKIVFAVALAQKTNGLHWFEMTKEGGEEEIMILTTPKFSKEMAITHQAKYERVMTGNGQIDTDEKLEELFTKLGLKSEYDEFLKVQITSNQMATKKEKETCKNLLNSRKVVVDFNKHIFLAKDREYNTVWAYLARSKKFGTVSFHVYLRNAKGRTYSSKIIEKKEVEEMGKKIHSIMENYEAYFNEVNKERASQILWTVKNAYDFSQIQDDFLDFSVDEVFWQLVLWMNDNVGKKINKKASDAKTVCEPVYCEEVNGEWRVGIWQEDIEFVFKELDMNTEYKTWKKEAVIHGYIKRGENRLATCVNGSVCQKYGRKSMTERVVLFNVTDEEMEMIKDSKMEAEKEKNNVADSQKNKEVAKNESRDNSDK